MIRAPWQAQTDLVITVHETASAPMLRWTLTCGPDGGTLPHPIRACKVLNSAWHPFAPVSPGVMCPMIVYGPQTATITGYWHGTWISAQFDRIDGCQAARSNKIASILPIAAGPVNPGGPMMTGSPVPAAS
jgi:hypothetical protein